MMWNFSQFGDAVAVVQENGHEFSYADICVASAELAAQIPGRCLTFNLCTNQVGSLLGYVSFLNHRIVPFMAEVRLNRELLDSLLDTYKPDYLWCPSPMAGAFVGCREVYSTLEYSLLKTPHTGVYELHDDLALLLTTSGSTGSPKLVRQSYDNIRANTESIVEYLALDNTERPITTLPMSYTYGLSILNTHLFVGASAVLTESVLLQRDFWQQFKRFEVTSFGGVPYTYEMLDKLRFFRMDLPSLRTMTQAGGKLSPKLHKKFAEHALELGKRFVVMYGQTEATARMSYLPPEKALEKYGSMGIAIPGGGFSLVGADGHEIQESEMIGELVYRGKNVTLGYAQRGEDLAKGDERAGILVTGDMAKRDDDGYYFIVGRKKRFLKVFGNRVNLDELDRLLQTAFPELDSACGGRDDEIFVFVTDGTHQEQVKAFLAEKTGLNYSAFHVRSIEEIPRSESGKVLYKEFAQYYKV